LKFYPGERLVVVGKVGSGIEIFFDSLIGLAKIDQGSIHLNDRLAYLNEEHFFRNTTVRENIRFFNK
jgi:ABC-type polysaccharide/polyol phosphate transport system ATPase subunit